MNPAEPRTARPCPSRPHRTGRRVHRLAAVATATMLAAGAAALTAAGPATASTPAGPAALPQAPAAWLAELARSERMPATRTANAAAVARLGEAARTLPRFRSSFVTDGTTYRYTMLGAKPESGRTVALHTVVVPLVMRFTGFPSGDVTFQPGQAVGNILTSPIFQTARYVNGRGQFTDQFQRATFASRMAPGWHTLMAPPVVSRPFTITVTPKTGQLQQVGGAPLGNMNIDAFDRQLHRILPKLGLGPDQTPLFVTQAVTADALGYHDAFPVPDGQGGSRVQTLMYTSWIDVAQIGPLLADISTLNHEVAEWVDDPYIDNVTPDWAFPPKDQVCGGDVLEVGDPIGNGPDFALFPTIPVRLNGYTYHLQNLSTLQWFSREVPSSAFRGIYSFPDTTQVTSPSAPCPPPS